MIKSVFATVGFVYVLSAGLFSFYVSYVFFAGGKIPFIPVWVSGGASLGLMWSLFGAPILGAIFIFPLQFLSIVSNLAEEK